MAESAVMFLVCKLKTLLEEEVNILSGIKAQVEEMVDELESIQAFLKAADAKEDRDPQKEVWVNQVRNVAHEMEDALDIFRHSHIHMITGMDSVLLCISFITSPRNGKLVDKLLLKLKA
ncbi:hypothetical protein ACLB2K_052723 [Fragaria x ananassa]